MDMHILYLNWWKILISNGTELQNAKGELRLQPLWRNRL